MVTEKVSWDTMMVPSFLDESPVLTEAYPQGPDGPTYIEKPTRAGKAIYNVISGTVVKVLKRVHFTFSYK